MFKRVLRHGMLLALLAAVLVAVPVTAKAAEEDTAGSGTEIGAGEEEPVIDYSGYTGVYKDLYNGTSDYYYYDKGEVQTGVTDVAEISGTWYNIVKGKVVGNTIAKNDNGWWYIGSDGKVDFTYTGFAQNKNGWFYVEKGKVSLNKNGVIHGKVDGTTGWWYVVSSKVRTSFTGLGNYGNKNGWWYIKDGKVDFTHNGVEKNKNGWWYVVGGKVQFNFTGLANYKNDNGWWYIKKGKVDFTHNGVEKNKNGWWYVTGGKVQFGYTGVANYKNAYGWWYVKGGKVDFDFTGVASNANGKWYVENGKVNFNADGARAVGTSAYYVDAGKVAANLTLSGGKYYYYNNGTKVTGWAKMGSGYAYFDRDSGAMKLGGTEDGITLASTGKAKASDEDVTKIKTMMTAREVYLSITSTSDSKSAKLKKCFDWVLKHPYKQYRVLSIARTYPNWMCTFANDEFVNGKGCCVSEACAFTFLANECGYTAYVCDDTSHAWTEIDGKVYDTLFAEAKNYSKYYGGSYATTKLVRINKTGI